MRRRALLSQSGKKLFVIDIDKYMTMEALSGGLKAKLTVSACQYCVDGDGDWKDLPADTFTEFVEEGHFLSFKATGLTPTGSAGIGTFVTVDDVAYQFNLRGNCMAMLYGDDAESYTAVPANGFRALFKNNTGLTEVSGGFLHADSTTTYGCIEMFRGCSSLISAPELPSTLNGSYNFYQMFRECSALTTAPALPATTLTNYCYAYMFYNCSSLQNAPVLPATTLKNHCYYYMFRGCSNITSITLPATTLVTDCYNRMLYNCSKLNYIKTSFTVIPDGSNALTQWVYGVAETGTFVKAADATWDVTGTSGVPEGWTVVGGSTIQYLTMTALEDGLTASLSTNACQYRIDKGTWTDLAAGTATPSINTGQTLQFKASGLTPNTSNGIGTFTVSKKYNLSGSCMSMIYGDEEPDNNPPAYAFIKMFYQSTTLIEVSDNFIPSTRLNTRACQYMFYGCTNMTKAPNLPATTIGQYVYYCMFQNCSSLVTIPSTLPATQLGSYCYANMFSGCKSITTAPILPAKTLQSNCYRYMFNSCSKLNYVKAMFTTTPSTSYTIGWLSGVASSGTFVKNSAATWDVVDTYGVPSGWTIQTATA